MNCPNCDRKMKRSVSRGCFTTFCELPEDGDFYLIETFQCEECKIKLTISIGQESWDIPEEYKPTEKQIKTIKMIDFWLGLNGINTVKTKKQGIKFISRYLKDSINAKSQQYEYEEDFWQNHFEDEYF